MTLKEIINLLQHQFDLHLKDEELVHFKINDKLEDLEKFQKKIQTWIDWALMIILGAVLVGLLALLGLKA
jgi:hypothetical protein